jgi:DNA repair exonuclease SbcCD ATPase subunit
MRTSANPVDELLKSAAKHWRAQRPLQTVEEIDNQLTEAVEYEKVMESWPKERWQQERDEHHAVLVARAKSLEDEFESLKRQLAVCAALMPRYPEGSAEQETLRKLLDQLKGDYAEISHVVSMQTNKMALRTYRRLRFRQNRAVIRELSDKITALCTEWALYNQEQTDHATLAIVLDANRCTSVTTPA